MATDHPTSYLLSFLTSPMLVAFEWHRERLSVLPPKPCIAKRSAWRRNAETFLGNAVTGGPFPMD